jgi:hypothetical protein
VPFSPATRCSSFLLPPILTHCQRGQLRADRSTPPSSHRLSAVRLSRFAIWTHPLPDNWTGLPAPPGLFLLEAPPRRRAGYHVGSLPGFLLPTLSPRSCATQPPVSLQADVVCVTCIHPLRSRTPFLSSHNNFYRLFSSCLEEIEREIAIDALSKPRLVRMSTSCPRMASTERSSRLTSAATLGTMPSYGLATTRLVIAD